MNDNYDISAWDQVHLQNKYAIALKRIKELEEEIKHLKLLKEPVISEATRTYNSTGFWID